MLKTVKATREGLIGHKTASGYVIDKVVSFVALPSHKALRKFVRVTNPANGNSTIAEVLDVGPWNVSDDSYVFGDDQPQAELGTDLFGRTTNGAGIDLGEYVYMVLQMTGNNQVTWEFIE